MKSLEELKSIRERMHEELKIRYEREEYYQAGSAEGLENGSQYRKHVLVCGGTGCTSSGSQKIREELEAELKRNGLENEICVIKTGCFGLCALGPIMIVYPEGAFYSMVKEEDIPEIVEEHLVKGNVVRHLLYDETVKHGEGILPLQETRFYKKQHRVALRNCGVISPEKIEEYIGTGGYEALGKVLTTMKPQDVIQIILDSGLRGRGGAGFPTGMKWKFAAANEADQKYVCCNADEGDPGAFMDRSVLEGDPHVVLEAMAIAGYAIGASQGYIYVRAEYPIAVERLTIAIGQARACGLLGKDIFGTGFDFNIELRLGAGAFVCGEETALMTSIEGNRGEPRPRPPFPALKGLFQKPTILNNVETLANIPQIILNGAQWFASMGTEKSKGTKVFALGGKVENTGLVEISMGTTLREIVEEIGGGIPHGKKFKAAQTGGPSGGCIPAEHFDVPIDYDNLIAIGSMMGSGGLIVMDEDTCMVDIAKFFLEFTVDESCGKCTPCRVGTRRMLEILEKITNGQGTMEDLDKLEELAEHLKTGSLCALGQTAPNPVLSTLRYFRDEYISHIVDKKCPAGVCKALLSYKIDADKCKGCTLCARTCPNDAITGSVKEPHVINQDKCVKCGACMEKCRFGAIYKE
ncbi:NADH-quinone oxidoreductase subunit NuoF [Dorea phocaeensis]|uniref:NADH-quinone oxidoreductase subunit NuoF n=1 Tax=Dorea phocaeensis TaxID=2040291 RepID=UPI001FA91F7E|nr:NADH-quinone oxidoreductase subunit NuoF [Dorea phocaeensis]